MRPRSDNSTAGKVRKRIERGGSGKLWTYADFSPLLPMAVAAALSRLTREGAIRRIRKGVYYCPRKTRFGEMVPDPTSVAAAVLKGRGVDWKASGLPAYNRLGLTTQVSPVITFDIPTRIYSLKTGSDAKLRLRPGRTVNGLTDKERAILDALRELPRIPDSSPADAVSKIRDLFSAERLSFNRMAKYSINEPPRVRALLGAIGSEIGASRKALGLLRKSLNPMTTFHLGLGKVLPTAREWRIR